jgi:hypothetical protein
MRATSSSFAMISRVRGAAGNTGSIITGMCQRPASETTRPIRSQYCSFSVSPTFHGSSSLTQFTPCPAFHQLASRPLGQELIGKPVLHGKASLNATLRATGFTIASSRRELAAVSAPADTARRLVLTRSAPVLRIRSVSRDVSGRPIDYYESLVRSDILTIAVNAEAANGVRGESR